MTSGAARKRYVVGLEWGLKIEEGDPVRLETPGFPELSERVVRYGWGPGQPAFRVVDGVLAEWTTSVGEIVYARELDPATVSEVDQLGSSILEAERRLADLRTERMALLKRAAERGERVKVPA